MAIYLIQLFTICVFVSLSKFKLLNRRQFLVVIIFIGIILVIIATFRSPLMRDYSNYATAFMSGEGVGRFEPGFSLLITMIRSHTTSIILFMMVIGLISITLNIAAIVTMSNLVPLSLIFYFANNYILHDLIQIR